MNSDDTVSGKLLAGGLGCLVLVAVGLFVLVAFIGPVIGVWQAGQSGKAELSRADYNRKVQIVSAHANLRAQRFNAQAEVVRAYGVAKANRIIKNSISDQYIRYLWVQTLAHHGADQIIYVPTEMGLPLTEAGRAVKPPK